MKYDRTFVFDELPDLQADKKHWSKRARYRKAWHNRVWGEVLRYAARPPVPLDSAEITCMRHSFHEPDRANNAYSFKPIIDGFVAAGVLMDDSPDILLREEYGWSHAPRTQGHVTIRIVSPCSPRSPSDQNEEGHEDGT